MKTLTVELRDKIIEEMVQKNIFNGATEIKAKYMSPGSLSAVPHELVDYFSVESVTKGKNGFKFTLIKKDNGLLVQTDFDKIIDIDGMSLYKIAQALELTAIKTNPNAKRRGRPKKIR